MQVPVCTCISIVSYQCVWQKKLKIKLFCTILCCTIGLKAWSPHLSLNQNQLWHVHTHFPFLHLSYKYLLPIFIGSVYTRCLFWLAWEVTVTLVLILRHSIENHALYWCQDNYNKCRVLYLRVTFLFQGSILDVIKNVEYCDVVNDEDMIIEHLRLLVNLSATNIAHDEIMTGAQEYFNILSLSLSEKVQVNWIVHVLAGI